MKRKILSLFLVLALVISAVPAMSLNANLGGVSETLGTEAFGAAVDAASCEVEGIFGQVAIGQTVKAIAKDANGNVLEDAEFHFEVEEYMEDEETYDEYLDYEVKQRNQGDTYTIPMSAAYVGRHFRVTAYAKDSYRPARSAEFEILASMPKVAVTSVTISGDPTVGETLIAVAKGAGDKDATNVTYQWQYETVEYDDLTEQDEIDYVDISGATGKTFRIGGDLQGKDIRVVVTGENSSQAESSTVRVKAATNLDLKAIQEAKAKLTSLSYDPVYGTDTNLCDYVKGKLGENSGITVAVQSTNITYGPTDSEAAIASDGTITYYYKDITSGITPDKKYVQFEVTFKLTKGEAEDTLTKKFNIHWNQAKLIQALKDNVLGDITETSIRGANSSLSEVAENMELPASVAGKTYASVKWESSDASVITIEQKDRYNASAGYITKVNRSNEDKAVTLTAYINSYNFTNNSAEDAAVKNAKKEFNVTVKAIDVEALKAEMQADLDNFNLSKITNFNLGGEADLSAVIDDLQLPNLRKSGVTNTAKYKQLSYSSDDETVVKVNSFRTYTYRPAYGEQAKRANITVKLTDSNNANLYVTKTIPVTVLPYQDSELDEEYEMLQKIKTAYFDGIKNANESMEAITGNLHNFKEGRLDAEGKAEFVYSVNQMNNCGIVPDDIPGYDPMGSAGWRTFKSSRPDIISHENMLVTQPKYDTEVTIESVLTSERFRAMAEANPTNEKLQRLYKVPVSVTVTVPGTDGPKPTNVVATTVRAIANFYDGTNKTQPIVYDEYIATSGLAESYGFNTPNVLKHAENNEVTMFDMLIAMLEKKYNVAGPNAENANKIKGELEVTDSGYVKTVLGESTSNKYFSMVQNQIMPNDGTYYDIDRHELNGLGIDDAVIKNGDVLNYFFYHDTYCTDNVGYFTQNGAKVTGITTPAEEPFTVGLAGYMAMFGMYDSETIEQFTDALTNVQLSVSNADGTFADIVGSKTDNSGNATITFNNEGTYIVTATGDEYYPLVTPYLAVNVTEITDAKKEVYVNADANALTFGAIKGENATPTAIEKNLVLVTRGESGKTSINWQSSDENVIKPDGTVIRPSNGAGDKTVKLTAKIYIGTKECTKEIDVIVTEKPKENNNSSTGGGGGSVVPTTAPEIKPETGAPIAKTEEKTDVQGNKIVTVTDINGKEASGVELSDKAVKEAGETGKPVEIAVPTVKPTEDKAAAPTVSIALPKGTDKAPVSIPVAEADNNTVLMKVNEDGSLTPVVMSVLSEDGTGMVATVEEGNYVVVENKVSFSDVQEDAWYESGVNFTASRGLMVGTGEGKFDQQAPLTTAQTAAVIGRMKGEGTSESWNAAVEKFGNTEINNRQNTISMLYEAYKELGGTVATVDTGKVEGFNDADAISAENMEAVRWAIEMGLINGVGEGRIDPLGELTRGQFSTMIERFVKLVQGVK